MRGNICSKVIFRGDKQESVFCCQYQFMKVLENFQVSEDFRKKFFNLGKSLYKTDLNLDFQNVLMKNSTQWEV